MKRSEPLKRTTPLRSVTPLKAKQPKKPSQPKRDPAEQPARDVVRQRSGGVCEACGSAEAREWHHRKNRSQGGEWSAANGLHLCPPDHKWVTEHPEQAAMNGWALRSWEDPLTKPVYYRGRWVVLDSEGGLTPALDFGQEAA